MPEKIDLIFIAGEASGDLHGARLIQQLLEQNPNLKIAAVAGPRMRALPLDPLFAMEDLQVMGFTDVFFALPRIARQFFKVRNRILALQPKAIVTIDYPGFNLRLAKSLRAKGYQGKIIHYICPTVWAWGKKRIPFMAKTFDLLLTFFPFEPACFKTTTLDVRHVGHPLAFSIPKPTPQNREPLIALFPGSRMKEVERNFPLQFMAAKQLMQEDPQIRLAVSIAHPHLEKKIHEIAGSTPMEFAPPEASSALMKRARLAIAKSGTVNLELALHETATVVCYAIRPFDVFLAQRIFKIRLPFYCIVNIILGRAAYPEFFGPHLTLENLTHSARNLWFNEEARVRCIEDCREVRQLLGKENSNELAASAILGVL